MMKKIMSLLLTLALLLSCAAALAEAAPAVEETPSAIPFNALPWPGELHTQWQLFATPTEWKMTAQSDPDTNCFVVTLFNPMDWGIAQEYCGSWKYDLENTKWVPMEEPAQEISPDATVLYMDAEEYYMNGFPGWQCYSTDERYFYMLEDYSSDPNNPDYFLNCASDESGILYSLGGKGFSLTSIREDSMSYSVYDDNGVMSMGTYTSQREDIYASYAVIANESEDPEVVAEEPYILYYINVQTADGGNWLWTEGAWQDIHGEEVAAPEGFNAEELPFELILP